MPHPPQTEIAIIGAGLCGLALARRMQAQGRAVTLFEARPRTGGRILSRQATNGHPYDLGPAWIWPHNTRMLALADALGIPLMPQHATGRLVFQDQTGHVRRDLDLAPMADALRLRGGLARLTGALTEALAPGTLHIGAAITGLTATDTAITLTTHAGQTHTARRVVLTLPPRLASTLAFTPPLPGPILTRLRQTPTWMAGQGKLVATFDTAFWRERGLSGDAISHTGPLMEIHDASADPAGRGAALFGFVGPRAARAPGTLKRDAIAQLVALFGPMAHPTHILVKDWSQDAATATPADQTGPDHHPTYGTIPAAWGGHLQFSGSETAPVQGGFLEGALEAAEITATILAG